MSDVVVENLARHWGATRALDGVSFAVPAGRFAVLLGPSGCGKSTLLRLIAGLEQPTGGRIRIGGRDVTDLPPAKRGIAMVFQSYALFPHLSVAQNICFGLEVRKLPAAERAKRLEHAAELLGLGKLLDRKPSQLSGGQQQRVALGRAIVAQAPVCLMDEPLSNLDAQLRHDMRLEIRELQRRIGITMIYVTHDQIEAMTMADQVVLLRDGHIEQDGPPDVLYAAPATVFAARFLGTPPMNVVDLDVDGRIAAAPGGTVALGVRPEDIRVVSANMDGAVVATVESVEFLGADTLIATRVGAGRLVARVPGRAGARQGETVGLAWTDAAQHIFDNRTGRRVAA
ncbi:MAG: ABC transporter ATP-binding protein [Tagaea sp.]